MTSESPLANFKFILAYLLSLATLSPLSTLAGDALAEFSRLNKAGLVLQDSSGHTIIADDADMPLTPASTTKLATAWMALTHWGENHHFITPFYWEESTQTLWVKGSGDPYLVSEELDIAARNLSQRGLRDIRAIGIDTSLFEPNLILPGTGTSDNPYDAVPTALAANFNTIAIRKIGGRVVSAESVTPLTAYAESFANTYHGGELRINTGPNPQNAEKYFAELLAAFLRKNGVSVGTQIIVGKTPGKTVFYNHQNSKTLGEMVRPMLKYSTNFVANQLILMLSAENKNRPLTASDVKQTMEKNLYRHFGWKNFSLEDGAGLSHRNKLSPRQLTELLAAFRNWKHLLPEIEPGIYAKTGTLKGVSALAGYLVSHGDWQPFAVVMNQNVPYLLRNRIAHELAGSVTFK